MALWDKYQYEPGLTFGSAFSAQRVVLRARKDIYAADGTKINEIPELVAEFATHGGEFDYENPNQEQDKAAMIFGNYFDLDSFCDANDLDAEERNLCAKRLLWWADRAPSEIWLHSVPKLPAPWPKYDQAHPKSIANLADQLGLLAEALAYEEQNKNRAGVVKALRDALSKEQASPAPEIVFDPAEEEDALTAA
jgi:hypothetical protein